MKKILLAGALVLVLGLAACAMLQTAKDVMCNPTPEQQAQAQAAAAFLDNMAGTVGGPVGLGYLTAKGIFLLVKPGICVALAQLDSALDTLNAAEKKALATRAKVTFPDVSALQQVVADYKKGKKAKGGT